MCYLKSTLSAIKIEKQETKNYDTVYVELIIMGNKKLMVAIVYRPPKQLRTNDTTLYEEIQFTIRNKNAIIVGDFNCVAEWVASRRGEPEVRISSPAKKSCRFFSHCRVA